VRLPVIGHASKLFYVIPHGKEMIMTGEPTMQVIARVPVSLVESATREAERHLPGVTLSGAVRLALARLAGLSDDYAAELPRGRKPKQAT